MPSKAMGARVKGVELISERVAAYLGEGDQRY